MNSVAMRPKRLVINRRGLAMLVPAWGLAACQDGYSSFPVTASAQRGLPSNIQVIRLDTANISEYAPRPPRFAPSPLPPNGRWDYRIGVNDVLNVIVFDHPDLTLPAGPQRSAEESGFRVQRDGTFFFPFIGQVRAEGRAPEQVRKDVTRRLSQFISNPQVEVRVAGFYSQSILVTGEVRKPSRLPLTMVPMTLLDAITATEGLTEQGDARQVTIQRSGQTITIDLQGFLRGGLSGNNPLLRHGDVVHVPRLPQTLQAFLLGEVQRPDIIELSRDPVTLTQAITRAGGLAMPRADATGVLVFRDAPPMTTVFQLDTNVPTGWILGARFGLQPGDIIYVVRSSGQRWNDAIARILPTVTALRLLVSPPSISVSQ